MKECNHRAVTQEAAAAGSAAEVAMAAAGSVAEVAMAVAG